MRTPLVRTLGLGKRYRSGEGVIDAVSGVSLQIEHGEFVAVLGRSGSGKSTLMHLLGLLERPDSGEYLFAGQVVSQLGADARAAIRRRQIGFVFQSAALLPRMTALENVELPLVYAGLGRRERRRRADEMLARVGLRHRASHWPRQLSGGEQQRVATARALVNEPALILADEPTGALDSRTAAEILDLFVGLNGEGRTLVVVTHAAEVAGRARRRIRLDDGRVVPEPAAAPRIIALAERRA